MTARQRELLSLLATWQGPELPRLSVLAARMGLANEAGVRFSLRPLVERGLVERVSFGRGLPSLPRLTEQGMKYLGLEAPRVVELENVRLGEPLQSFPISCGPLVEANAEPKYLQYLSDLFSSFREGDYLLFARGDSMVSPEGDSIHDGDRCLVRPGIPPTNGDTVHAEYIRDDGVHDCTLKDFQSSDDGIVTLRPRNPRFSPIVQPGESITVRGVVLEVLHSVRRLRPVAATPPPRTNASFNSNGIRR